MANAYKGTNSLIIENDDDSQQVIPYSALRPRLSYDADRERQYIEIYADGRKVIGWSSDPNHPDNANTWQELSLVVPEVGEPDTTIDNIWAVLILLSF